MMMMMMMMMVMMMKMTVITMMIMMMVICVGPIKCKMQMYAPVFEGLLTVENLLLPNCLGVCDSRVTPQTHLLKLFN